MAELSSLPTELLLKVFANVPNEYLKELALTCRKFAPIAQEYLFCTLSVASRKRQLRVLLHVSKHPVLSRYVQHLYYDMSLHTAYPTLERYKAEVHRLYEGSYTESELSAGHRHTESVRNDHIELGKTNAIEETLLKAMPKFPKLHQVSFSFRYTGPYPCNGAPPFPPRSQLFQPDHEIALRAVFRALKKTNIQLRKLCLDPIIPTRFDQACLLRLKPRHARATVQRVMTSLRTIKMRFSQPDSTNSRDPLSPPVRTVTSLTTVAGLLQGAAELRHLDFGFQNLPDPTWRDSRVLLHYPLRLQFGDGFRWHHLESLKLENMALYKGELDNFLNLHESTLRKVVFANMAILFVTLLDNTTNCMIIVQFSRVRFTLPRAASESFVPWNQWLEDTLGCQMILPKTTSCFEAPYMDELHVAADAEVPGGWS